MQQWGCTTHLTGHRRIPRERRFRHWTWMIRHAYEVWKLKSVGSQFQSLMRRWINLDCDRKRLRVVLEDLGYVDSIEHRRPRSWRIYTVKINTEGSFNVNVLYGMSLFQVNAFHYLWTNLDVKRPEVASMIWMFLASTVSTIATVSGDNATMSFVRYSERKPWNFGEQRTRPS